MIRAIIIDDEPEAIASLKNVLSWYCEDDVTVVGTAHSATEAWPLVKELQPDLCFLDVQMGEENGFMLLEKLNAHYTDIAVIFTTAHAEYAIPAIRKAAFDYLLKPIDGDDLQVAVARLKKRIGATSAPATADTGRKVLSLPMQDQVRVVPLEEIIRCEADRNYTRFFLVDGSILLVSRHLGSFTEYLLANNFFRSHKSNLVNLGHLQSYVRHEGGYLLMRDGSQVPLARAQRPALFEILGL